LSSKTENSRVFYWISGTKGTSVHMLRQQHVNSDDLHTVWSLVQLYCDYSIFISTIGCVTDSLWTVPLRICARNWHFDSSVCQLLVQLQNDHWWKRKLYAALYSLVVLYHVNRWSCQPFHYTLMTIKFNLTSHVVNWRRSGCLLFLTDQEAKRTVMIICWQEFICLQYPEHDFETIS